MFPSSKRIMRSHVDTCVRAENIIIMIIILADFCVENSKMLPFNGSRINK